MPLKKKSTSERKKPLKKKSTGERKKRSGNDKPHLFKEGNPGRPKGSRNRFTTLRRSFLEVFEQLGGADGLATWATSSNGNRAAFYRMISTMLPKNVNVSGEDHALRLAEQMKENDPKMYEAIVVALNELEQEVA